MTRQASRAARARALCRGPTPAAPAQTHGRALSSTPESDTHKPARLIEQNNCLKSLLKSEHALRVCYLQRVTGGWLLVRPALLLLLFHLHSSTSCLRLFLFPGHSEPLPLSFPCFRVLRVLHCPSHPEMRESLLSVKPKPEHTN